MVMVSMSGFVLCVSVSSSCAYVRMVVSAFSVIICSADLFVKHFGEFFVADAINNLRLTESLEYSFSQHLTHATTQHTNTHTCTRAQCIHAHALG